MRRFLVALHRWTGLLMAVFLIVVGMTGAILPFRVALERLIVPGIFAMPPSGAVPLDLATLAERAEAQESRAEVGYFALTDPDRVSIQMQPRIDPATGQPFALDFDHVFLDPVTGRELGRRRDGDLSQGWINAMPFVFDLHASLAMGDGGALVLGIVALAWTIDCFISFCLTVPMLGRLRFYRWLAGFRVRPAWNAFRLNFDLHRAGGLWLWPALFAFAWSSVMFDLRPVYEAVTAATLGLQPAMAEVAALAAAHKPGPPKLNWRQAQARGAELMSGIAARDGIRVERPFGLAYIDIFGVYVYDARTSADVGGQTWESGVWIDGDTGALVKVFRPSGAYPGDIVGTWLYALHFGDYRSVMAYRIFVSAAGLAVAMLAGTGVYIWWRKQRARIAAIGLRARLNR